MKKFKFILILINIFWVATLADISNAAPCSTGGAVTITTSCEINGVANYTDLTITGGAQVTSGVGNKIEIIATGKVQIDPGSGIDVSGKGNNTAGKGGDGSSSGVACAGVYGSGGGGGGYGSVGGQGGTDVSAIGGAGGATYGDPNNPTDLGSPGGDGGAAASGGGYGGLGGGTVIIKAKKVVIKNGGYVYANGAKGGPGGPAGGCGCPPSRDGTGGGGGGSGGTVNIDPETFDFDGTIKANGGDGGDEWNSGGWDGSGGGGGGGRVFVYYIERTGSGTIEVNGGNPGVLACGVGVPGGAGSGSIGSMVNPCTLHILTCPDICIDDITKGYNGICDLISGKCVYTETRSCADADECTIDSCDKGLCSNFNVCGGLVPCGRKYDDPSTSDIDEKKPCQLCHLFVMLDRIIDFLLVYILFPIAVLMLVIAGILYVFTIFEILPGGFQTLSQAKGIILSVILGLLVIFAAFVLIGLFLMLIGLADWTTNIYKDWWSQGLFQIKCEIR